MKLALLSVDEHLMRIARAAAAGGEHSVTIICQPGGHGGELLRLFPAARLENQWETLTLAGEFDRLLIGLVPPEHAPLREEQLRRFVQEGVPVVAVHPPAEAIVMHELAMIPRDVGGLLAAWNPACEHQGVRRVLELLRANEKSLGPVMQVNWQRELADTSPRAVLGQLACDAEVLQEITGRLDRVSAIAPAPSENSLAGLAVTFAGAEQVLGRWSVQAPDAAGAGDELTILAAHGRIALRMPHDENYAWTVDVTVAGSPDETIRAEVESRLALIQSVVQRETNSAPATWSAACRATELAEAAQQSLRRGRTIQLYYEEHSEQQTFKSVMAAGGCLLLMALVALLGIIAVIDVVGGPLRQNLWWRLWPIYVFAPIAFFLLLQSLWRVFAAPPAKPAARWSGSEGAK